MALSKEDIFKTGPSPEEEKYNTAVELMDAIDCVERFERAVTSLRSAAAMFEELGDYEDARKRRKQCADKADQIEREGCEKTLQTAKDMYDKAKTKSDYIAANSENRRKKKKAAEDAAAAPTPATVAAAPVQEADNSELIAVIAAAIAASEGTSTDGFVVRSIRKINRKKR